jgi:hypothetical protein
VDQTVPIGFVHVIRVAGRVDEVGESILPVVQGLGRHIALMPRDVLAPPLPSVTTPSRTWIRPHSMSFFTSWVLHSKAALEGGPE